MIRGLADHGPAILDRQVADLMTRPVHSCRPDDSVKHLMSEMTRKRIRHLPVIDDGVLKSRWKRTCSATPISRARDRPPGRSGFHGWA